MTNLMLAARVLVRYRLSTALIVLIIGSAVGLNTVVFSAAYRILLRPLPGRDPASLVFLSDRSPGAGTRRLVVTSRRALEWRDRTDLFEGVAAVALAPTSTDARFDYLVRDGAPVRLNGALVTPNFFELLGVPSAIGRTFGEADGDARVDLVAVLGHHTWRRHFGADPAVVGRHIHLMVGRPDRRTQTAVVVGVLPEGFAFTYPEHTDIWVLHRWSVLEARRHVVHSPLEYYAVARLRSGVSLAGARAGMARVENSTDERRRTVVEALHDYAVGAARPALLLVAVTAGFLLCLGCVSVATLMLGRVSDRGREVAIRRALGARQHQLYGLLLAESLLLALGGGVVAVVLTYWSHPVLVAVVPANMPRADELALGHWSWVFAGAATLATVFAAGVLPARHLRRVALSASLGEGGATVTVGRHARAWGRVLVTGQIAFVTALLAGTALLLSSLWALSAVPLGFDPRNVTVIHTRVFGLSPQAILELQRRVLTRAKAGPGVHETTATSAVPLMSNGMTWIVQRPDRPGWRAAVRSRQVDPSYFAVMRIPLRAGRTFRAHEDGHAPPVAVVSEAFARLAFPNENPLGRRLSLHGEAEVIGIVSDVCQARLDRTAEPAVYVPFAQYPTEEINVVIRTSADAAASVLPGVKEEVATLAPGQPVLGVYSLERVLDATLSDRRMCLVAVGAFAFVGLLLAVAGVFGVVSRSVTERTREIGIRVTLGARPVGVGLLVLQEGLKPLAAGLAVGLFGAAWLHQLLRAFLYEARGNDAATAAVVAGVVVVVTLAGCAWPVYRAIHLDPARSIFGR